MIEVLQGFPGNVVAFACHGHVTRSDYLTVLIPAVEKALRSYEKVRLYYETATDFKAIDAGAVWEDTRVGIGHFLRWERFAVVTDVEWIKHTVKFFSFLLPGELKVFSTAEAPQARQWSLRSDFVGLYDVRQVRNNLTKRLGCRSPQGHVNHKQRRKIRGRGVVHS